MYREPYHNIETIQTVIRELCNIKSITLEQLCIKANLNKTTLDKIVKHNNIRVTGGTFDKIAKGFDMDPREFSSYLYSKREELGFSDDYHKDIITERVRNLRKQKKLTLYEVKEATSLSIDYEDYIHFTDFSQIITLADYFNVSIDYLVGRTDNPTRL